MYILECPNLRTTTNVSDSLKAFFSQSHMTMWFRELLLLIQFISTANILWHPERVYWRLLSQYFFYNTNFNVGDNVMYFCCNLSFKINLRIDQVSLKKFSIVLRIFWVQNWWLEWLKSVIGCLWTHLLCLFKYFRYLSPSDFFSNGLHRLSELFCFLFVRVSFYFKCSDTVWFSCKFRFFLCLDAQFWFLSQLVLTTIDRFWF